MNSFAFKVLIRNDDYFLAGRCVACTILVVNYEAILVRQQHIHMTGKWYAMIILDNTQHSMLFSPLNTSAAIEMCLLEYLFTSWQKLPPEFHMRST